MDQEVLCLLLPTLSVEALSEVINYAMARSAWIALHDAYSNSSAVRISQLLSKLSLVTQLKSEKSSG